MFTNYKFQFLYLIIHFPALFIKIKHNKVEFFHYREKGGGVVVKVPVSELEKDIVVLAIIPSASTSKNIQPKDYSSLRVSTNLIYSCFTSISLFLLCICHANIHTHTHIHTHKEYLYLFLCSLSYCCQCYI